MNIVWPTNYKNAKVKSLELCHKEDDDVQRYFIKGIWEYEAKDGRYELGIPYISLPIKTDVLPTIIKDQYDYVFNTIPYGIQLQERYLQIERDEEGNYYYIKELERFEKEMTLEEIEQKLGYKIKLVDKKER